MCTVVVRVGADPSEPVQLLAIRDEDPARAWDPLGPWWPQTHPGVIGVRDSRAGGAWLAADAERRRVAVVLNRAEAHPLGPEHLGSRGALVLDAVAGRAVPDQPRVHGFNLVEIGVGTARVTSWDGERLRAFDLAPGTHMLAHDDVDDDTPRIAAWLEDFRVAAAAGTSVAPSGTAPDTPPDTDTDTSGTAWWAGWLDVLGRSTRLDPTDDRAIIRDNRAHGYPTLSLLACVAEVGPDGIDVRYGELDRAGVWNPLTLTPAVSEADAR